MLFSLDIHKDQSIEIWAGVIRHLAVTKDVALSSEHGIYHENYGPGVCRVEVGPHGRVTHKARRWRANGQVKTWKSKSRASHFRVPLKYGLRGPYSDVTHATGHLYHEEGMCPLAQIPYDRDAIVRELRAELRLGPKDPLPVGRFEVMLDFEVRKARVEALEKVSESFEQQPGFAEAVELVEAQYPQYETCFDRMDSRSANFWANWLCEWSRGQHRPPSMQLGPAPKDAVLAYVKSRYPFAFAAETEGRDFYEALDLRARMLVTMFDGAKGPEALQNAVGLKGQPAVEVMRAIMHDGMATQDTSLAWHLTDKAKRIYFR